MRELEAALAANYDGRGLPRPVSGHATNVTVIGQLMGPRDLVLHDQLIHNSVAEGARLSGARRIAFPHNDWGRRSASWRRTGAGMAGRCWSRGPLQHGWRPARPGAFAEMARRHDALLMVDEAHSFGVLGATGRGSPSNAAPTPGAVDIWMGTLSKTLSACGGYIAGQPAAGGPAAAVARRASSIRSGWRRRWRPRR